MKKLHKNQKDLLALLKINLGDPLTIRELQSELGLSSPSLVHHHIKQLETKGYLRRNPSNPSDYQILINKPDRKATYLNLYGVAQCGPNGLILDGNPIDRILISTKFLGFNSLDAFLVKAKGDSMEPKINNGDLVIVKNEKKPKNGDIIVCSNNDSVMIKKFERTNQGNIFLISLNTLYPPILVNKNNFRVEGVVKSILSYT